MFFFLFEVIYCPNESNNVTSYESLCDHINLMYLRVLGEILSKNGNRYAFYLFGQGEDGNKKPITSGDFFRLRFFMGLSPDEWNSCLLVYHSFSRGGKREDAVIHLYKDNRGSDARYGGRILPLIDITRTNYEILIDNAMRQPNNEAFYDILDRFREKILEYLGKHSIPSDGFYVYDEQDTLFDKLLYASTIYFLIEDADSQTGGKKQRIIDIISKREYIHEKCVDFAQGILQLVENSLIHVVNSESGGYGNFCVRIRKRNNTVALGNRFLPGNGVGYYMEVYVTDRILSHQDSWGIVEKFYDNAEKRARFVEDKDEEKCLNQVIESRRIPNKRIRIEQMFGVDAADGVLQKYLCLPQNMAYHYGLQILDNVVFTGEGCLYVQSGMGSEGYYMTSEQKDFIPIDIEWEQGTAYVVYLPLKMETAMNTSFMDSIAVNDDGSHEGVCVVEFPYSDYLEEKINSVTSWSGEEKEKIINCAIKKVCEEGIPKSVYIDCARYHKSVHWEIIAKLAFLCLATKKAGCDNVALINVSSKYEVIKLFRQVALFYNRKGENEHMIQKSVFIVDRDAEMDILLKGPLSSMLKNMYISQIYGGINERAMRVVEYFVGRK